MTGRTTRFATNVLPCLQVAAISEAEDFTLRDEDYYVLVTFTSFHQHVTNFRQVGLPCKLSPVPA